MKDQQKAALNYELIKDIDIDVLQEMIDLRKKSEQHDLSRALTPPIKGGENMLSGEKNVKLVQSVVIFNDQKKKDFQSENSSDY